MPECWCHGHVRGLEERVRRGLLKADYGKTEVKNERGAWVVTHEWEVSAAGTRLFCAKERR